MLLRDKLYVHSTRPLTIDRYLYLRVNRPVGYIIIHNYVIISSLRVYTQFGENVPKIQ